MMCTPLSLALCLVLTTSACQKSSSQSNSPPPGVPEQTKPIISSEGDPVAPVAMPEPSRLAQFTAHLDGSGPLVATIATSKGEIACTLFETKTPIAVTNFVGLATGKLDWVDPSSNARVSAQPYYNGLSFSRVIPDFLIQAGDRAGDGSGHPGYTIPDEIVKELKHDRPGMLSMANAGPDTSGAQFFITTRATPHLDGRHTIFGQCAPDAIVLDISRAPADAQDRPLDPILIDGITFSRAAE